MSLGLGFGGLGFRVSGLGFRVTETGKGCRTSAGVPAHFALRIGRGSHVLEVEEDPGPQEQLGLGFRV